jgi:hypothetical protein
MFVILDTTEFFDSPRADSNSFRVLQEYVRRTQSHLVVPEIVVREVINHVRERLLRVESNLRDAEQDYEKLRTIGAGLLTVDRPNFDDALRAYAGSFRGTLRYGFNTLFLPIPTVAHDELLERALLRKRPFAKGKDGYRDALIWLSIVAYVKEHPAEYVFITNNVRDFSEKDLRVDLGELPAGCTLKYENDLKSFNDTHAKVALERLNALADRLHANLQLPGVDLRDKLSDLSHDTLAKISSKLRIRSLAHRDVEEPYYIESYDVPAAIAIKEVYRAEGKIMVECSASYECTIEGYMFLSDAYGLSDEENIHVTDWEWNDHYAAVEFVGTIETLFLIRLAEVDEAEQTTYLLESIEILEARMEHD